MALDSCDLERVGNGQLALVECLLRFGNELNQAPSSTLCRVSIYAASGVRYSFQCFCIKIAVLLFFKRQAQGSHIKRILRGRLELRRLYYKEFAEQSPSAIRMTTGKEEKSRCQKSKPFGRSRSSLPS